jgi:hypothetical protein
VFLEYGQSSEMYDAKIGRAYGVDRKYKDYVHDFAGNAFSKDPHLAP